jgi:preprotein translocase subunit SecG
MMKSAVLKKFGVGLSALFLITALGLAGCASEQQIKADREASEAAVKKAEDAAARAEAAAKRAEDAAAKCEKTFEKSLQK